MSFHVIAIHVKPSAASGPAPRVYGPREPVGAPRRCRTCQRPIPPAARRHACARCAVAASRGAVAVGPCAACGNADVRVLGQVELVDGRATLCANDRAVLGRLRLTLEELRAEVELASADVAGAGGLLEELLAELGPNAA